MKNQNVKNDTLTILIEDNFSAKYVSIDTNGELLISAEGFTKIEFISEFGDSFDYEFFWKNHSTNGPLTDEMIEKGSMNLGMIVDMLNKNYGITEFIIKSKYIPTHKDTQYVHITVNGNPFEDMNDDLVYVPMNLVDKLNENNLN
jgi:hypothetical protein